MDEARLHTEQHRASQAERLLNDPLLNECMDRVRNGYLIAWQATKPDDVAKREQLWNAIRGLDEIKREIRAVAETGKMAKVAIERLLKQQNVN
jgi:hypothetical protein